MSLKDLPPDPPAWALEAGLPPPRKKERFTEYATRLGLEIDELYADLTDRTAPIAHLRMEAVLMKAMPHAFDTYVQARRRAVLRSL